MREEGKRPVWTVVQSFELEGTDLVVEVSQNDAPRPRYSYRVGKKGERGTIPFIQVFTEGQGTIRVVSTAAKVAELIAQAEEFVRQKVQEHEDAYIERRIEREMRQVEKEGKKRRPSGYKQRGRPAA